MVSCTLVPGVAHESTLVHETVTSTLPNFVLSWGVLYMSQVDQAVQ